MFPSTPTKPPVEADSPAYPENPFDENFTADNSYNPPTFEGKDDTKSRLGSKKNVVSNLFASTSTSDEDPTPIKERLEKVIRDYGLNQAEYNRYKAAVVDKISQDVRELAGNQQFSDGQKLSDYKETLINANPEVFLNDNFKKFIEDVFDFYSTPERLGTGENVREGHFDISNYNIEGGTESRRAKRTKRRRNIRRKKTRKHRR